MNVLNFNLLNKVKIKKGPLGPGEDRVGLK